MPQDAKGAGTEVMIDINGEEFKTKGLMVLERNYLDVCRPILMLYMLILARVGL